MNFYWGTRRSIASSSTAAVADPVKDDFPEALTYRFNDNSAWVPAAKSHDASFFFLFLLSYYNFMWLNLMGCAGGHRPCKTRISRITERSTRMHNLSHNGQVEHSMYHPGGMATRCAATAPIPRRGRENSRYGGIRGGLGTSRVPLLYGRCYDGPAARKGGTKYAERSTTPTTPTIQYRA